MLRKHHLIRLVPISIIVISMATIYFTPAIRNQFSIESLKAHQGFFHSYSSEHPFLAPLFFMAIYVVSVCLIIPDSTILTLLAGLSFVQPLAIIYCVIAETLGALLFFQATKLFSKEIPKPKKPHPLFDKMRYAFQKNAAAYLLCLRLSHLAPFWLINLAAGYFNISWRVFLWTTAVGILPLTYLLVQAGHQLGDALAAQTPFTLSTFFDTQTELTLLFFALIALLPIFYRRR